MLQVGRILPGQMADTMVGHDDIYGVFVVRVVRVRPQDGDHILTDPVGSPGMLADDMPQGVLMTGLTNHFKGLPATEHEDFWLMGRKGGFRRRISNGCHGTSSTIKPSEPGRSPGGY
jgi:hypothetical protein